MSETKIPSARLDTTEFTFTELAVGNGSVSLPSYSFTNDQDSGLYLGGANFISVSLGGADAFSFAGVGSGSAFLPGIDNVHALGSTALGWTKLYMMDGTAALPSITFRNDNDTGVYRPGANRLGFATGGVEHWEVTSAGDLSVVTTGRLLLPDGSAGSPGIAFANDLDTGVYRAGTDRMEFVAGGTTTAIVFPTEMNVRQDFYTERTNTGGTVSSFVWNDATTNLASHAKLDIKTMNASVGDPFIKFEINTVSAWSLGIDNSDGDKFKITPNAAVGGGALGSWSIDTANSILHEHPGAGSTCYLDMNASDNTNPATTAAIRLRTGGSTAGDPFINFLIQGVQNWSAGIDNSDSDIFVIDNSNTLSGGGQFAITPNATAQVIGQNGTAALPYYSFYNRQDTGLYYSGSVAGEYSLSAEGTQSIRGHKNHVAIYTQGIERGGWNSAGNLIPNTDNTYSTGQSGLRWSAVWAANGTIQTSHSSTKQNIVEVDPLSVEVPQGVFFDRDGRRFLGYLNDSLPAEGRPVEDPLANYEQAVIGVLCAHVRKLEADNAEMKSLIQDLKNKVEA